MLNWFCDNILGLENTESVLDLRIGLSWGVGWVAMLLIFASIAMAIWLYRKEAHDLSLRYRIILCVLRCTCWFVLLMVLFRPFLLVERLTRPKSGVVLLFDTSASMGFTDDADDGKYYDSVWQAVQGSPGAQVKPDGAAQQKLGTTPRIKLLEEALNNSKVNFPDRLNEKFAMRSFAFDSSLKEFTFAENDEGRYTLPVADGITTSIGSAIKDTGRKLEGVPLSAIILFTDGANNKGGDPALAAAKLAQNKTAIFPVAFGAGRAVDLAIVEAVIPDVIFQDDELAVKVTMDASVLEGQSIPIEIKAGDKVIGRKEITCKNGTFSEEVVIKPPQSGEFVITVTAGPHASETFTGNNTWKKRVQIIDEAMRVLIIAQTPNWEYRYLKGFLDSDARVKANVLMRQGDPRRIRVDPEYLDKMPDYKDLRKDYDCIVLTNISADYFSNEQLENMRKFIADDGGALIVLSSATGTPGSFIETPVEKMLPVVLRRGSRGLGAGGGADGKKEFKLNLTREGRRHVITRLVPESDKNVQLWKDLPGHYWYFEQIEKLKPSAVALVEHATASNEFGPLPLIAYQRYGRGQVLYLGINSVWRWRYKVGNRYTNRFWGQAIQFMGLPHRLGMLHRVVFERPGGKVVSGEPVDLQVSVLDENFIPLGTRMVKVQAVNQQGEKENMEFTSEAGRQGVYTAKARLPAGMWKLTVEGMEAHGELTLEVTEPMYENEQPAMQEEVLRRVAADSGGEFLRPGDMWRLPEMLSSITGTSREKRTFSLWDNYILLVVVFLLTAVEWIMRRWKDLP